MKAVNIPKKKEPRATDKGSGGVATLMANERAFRFLSFIRHQSQAIYSEFLRSATNHEDTGNEQAG